MVPAIVHGYTREAGVRELERRIARIARKLARRQAEQPVERRREQRVAVGGSRRSLLGTPPYDPDDTSLEDKVGVASGLAYTSVGGEVLEIEVSVVRGRGKVQLTGTLGDVMKESASAALSYARSRAKRSGSIRISIATATCTCTSPPARRRRMGRRPASRSPPP